MLQIIALSCLGALFYFTITIIRDWRVNIEKAKKTGLPYMLGRMYRFMQPLADLY